MEIIKTYQDGSKKLKFNGIEFSVNPAGVVLWAEDWGVVDMLEAAGLATRKFYKHLFGHVEHTLA